MQAQQINDLANQIFASAARSMSEVSFKEVLVGFYHAITWSEPFIVGLLTVHLLLLIVSWVLEVPEPRSG